MKSLILLYFFLFSSLFFHIPPTWAGRSKTRICPSYGPFIESPFCLNDTALAGCTDPNYAVKCDSLNRTILTLPPTAGEFSVHSFNYGSQTVTINELDSFFNCSPEVAKKWAKNRAVIKVIECLSGENFAVVAVPEDFVSLSPCLWMKNGSAAPAKWLFYPDLVRGEKSTTNRAREAGHWVFGAAAASKGGLLSWGAKYGMIFSIGIIFLLIKH